MVTKRSEKTQALAKLADENVMSAHTYSNKKHFVGKPKKRHHVDITDWLIQEKIDGARCILRDGKLYSKYGNLFYAPQEYLDLITDGHSLELDGELIIPGIPFEDTLSVVRTQKKASMESWQNVVFQVFDYRCTKTKYEDRLANLQNKLKPSKNRIVLPTLATVQTPTDVSTWLKKVEDNGGEGLILRNTQAVYQYGRSWNLLKVKSFITTEVTITEHIPGTVGGKHEGTLGKYVCLTDDGKVVEVGNGMSVEQRKNPLPIGSVITIRYKRKTKKGVPYIPIFVAERNYE